MIKTIIKKKNGKKIDGWRNKKINRGQIRLFEKVMSQVQQLAQKEINAQRK